MDFQKELYIGITVVIGILFISYAYKTNDDNFWKYFDTGMIFVVVSWQILAHYSLVLSIIGWGFSALVINSAIASFFFDVTVFGKTKMIFGWVVACVVAITGIYFSFVKYKKRIQQRKKDNACKLDAKKKYANMLNKLKEYESRIGEKNESIDNFIKQLTNE